MATLDGTGGKDIVKVVFEVRACVEKGEMRVTGNTASLGKWNVYNSVKMDRSTEHENIWSVEVVVPVDSLIQYRYVVTRGELGGAFTIVSLETFPEPRAHTCLKSTSVQTLRGEYEVSEAGQSHTGDGWLVSTSELHLQLGTLGSALSISDHPPDTRYLLTIHPFSIKQNKTVDCSPCKAKLLSRTEGDYVTFDLADGGCPYNQQTNLVIFTTESVDFQDTGFSVDVYRIESDCTPALPIPLSSASKVGRASLFPRQYLGDQTSGQVTLTVFSHLHELLPIGTLSLSFLLIHPVRELPLLHSTKHTYSNCWRQHKRMLHIGHRGLGDSHHPQLKATETENTIASLKMAGNYGADYVEFDVHLTRDHVPVVYHNFLVATTLAREGFFSGELYAMEVKDLTLHQLQSLKLDNSHASGEEVEIPCNCSNKGCCSNKTCCSDNTCCSSSIREIEHEEKRKFPTLENVFHGVPPSLGFNIEVKYPLPERAKDGTVGENYDCFDCNDMADTILKVVDHHAGDRMVIFSCFNPDMCTVLRRKQSKYPVMFLTACLNPIYDDPLDVRAHTMHDAMMHVTAEKLSGIVADSYIFLENPHLIKVVKERGIVLFSWGDTNNDSATVEMQANAGVDAVICDCIDKAYARARQ